MTRRRVAIIGAGFSGAAVAVQLMKRGRAAPDVLLIERNARFGPGLAYGVNNKSLLLNVRASNISAFADKPDHFAKWLGGDSTRFAERAKYGAYIEQALRQAHGGWFGPKLKRVRDNVLACKRTDARWRLELASGASEDADVVVLAMGAASPTPPSIFAQNAIDVLDPWDAAALQNLPKGDVLLLGAGLTMIDVALSLVKRRRKGVIYALSRRGLTPRTHLDNPKPAPPGGVDLPERLSDAVSAMRREVAAIAKRGEPWQYAVDRLRARTPELWRRLGPEQQARFLRHLRPWWDVHRHRAAPQIAQRVEALKESGRLKVLAGDIVAADMNEKGRIEVQHRQRGSLVRHRLEVAGVVNCTGATLDPRQSKDALVQQLMTDGVARAHANGLGFDVDAEGRVIDAAGAAQHDVFALGPLTQGAFWECTAVPEIRVRAAVIAMMLAPER